MFTKDYDYNLPDELIAQRPAETRGASRLMEIRLKKDEIKDRQFADIVDMLDESYFLVMNNTSVVPARIAAKKETGGQSEVFYLSGVSDFVFTALVRGKTHEGTVLIAGEHKLTVLEKFSDGSCKLSADVPVGKLLEECGKIPLPPYIAREADAADEDRYQTVYAKGGQSVAAPTAGLHFTEEILAKLRAKGVQTVFVTLDVGIGTFRPIKTDIIEEHVMHSEDYFISNETADLINKLKAEGKKLLAVGTTSVRTLESACDNGVLKAGGGSTNLFITPDYKFKLIDGMLTNFHLPKSSLMVLVGTLMGKDYMLKAYGHAVAEKYKFYSYGDAMLIY